MRRPTMHLVKQTESQQREPEPDFDMEETVGADGYILFEHPNGTFDVWRRQQPKIDLRKGTS
jgi:hypothetical protein